MRERKLKTKWSKSERLKMDRSSNTQFPHHFSSFASFAGNKSDGEQKMVREEKILK